MSKTRIKMKIINKISKQIMTQRTNKLMWLSQATTIKLVKRES